MVLSEEKVSHLSHLILKAVKGEKGVRVKVSDLELLKEIKHLLARQLNLYDEIDRFARTRIQSYARSIPEGSREWEVMYEKIFGEEMARKMHNR